MPGSVRRSAQDVVVRIVARKLADGRVEFGLRKVLSDGTLSGNLLPRSRMFPTTAAVGSWLQSTPISVITTQPSSTTTTPTTTTPTTEISVGGWHSCGRRTDGSVACWGNNGSGQSNLPSGQFSGVAAGGWQTCALRAGHGQSDAPAGQFTAVAGSWFHSCGLRADGSISCWGLDDSGQVGAPAGRFTSVDVGLNHSCGLRVDGTIGCWGANSHGQVSAPRGQFTAVAGGFDYSCGLRTDGTVVCWGLQRRLGLQTRLTLRAG